MMTMGYEAGFTPQWGYPRQAVDAVSLSPLPSCVDRFEIVVVVLIQTTKVSATLIAQSLAGISRRRLNSATQGPSAN